MKIEDKIRKIISEGEKLDVEFKSDRAQISDQEIIDVVVALANNGGGILLIGVEDDGTVTGAKPRHGKKTNTAALKATVLNNTVPNIEVEVEVSEVNGVDLIIIEVKESREKIFSTAQGKVLKREIGGDGKPGTFPFYPHEQTAKTIDMGLLDYSALIFKDASLDDLDPLEFERLKQLVSGLRGDQNLLQLPDADIAKAMRLVESIETRLVPNLAGLLLLGRESSIRSLIPTHKVFFQILDRKGKVKVNDSFEGPLLKTLHEIQNRFDARNEEQEIQHGLYRLSIPDYSREGFREALINAVLHRDYTKMECVYVQWHPDHILITNPGGFPEGITVKNFLVHEPKPRNPRLAEAFRRIGLAEQTARGIDKIFAGQLRYGRSLPDYSRSDSNGVRLVIKGGKASLEFAALVYDYDSQGTLLGLDELLVINHLFLNRRIDPKIAGEIIQKGSDEGRIILERFHEKGLIEARGQARKRHYHFTPAIYKKLNMHAEYVRAKGFEPYQQEQMVIDYVKAHGRITRAQVADLCKISSEEAKELLKKIRERHNEFKLQGEKRGAFYIWDQ